ncbi:MAG: hypothetical protein U1F43_36185 [Myxococcota bacterium]
MTSWCCSIGPAASARASATTAASPRCWRRSTWPPSRTWGSRRARPEPLARVPDDALLALRARVAAEDADGAEAILRAAVREGAPLATLTGWLAALVNDHLLDFGHARIYLPKLAAWLDGEAPVVVDLALGAFVRSSALATREELVPEWSWVVRARARGAGRRRRDGRGALLTLMEARAMRSCRPCAARWRSGRAPTSSTIWWLRRAWLLRFDLQIERDPSAGVAGSTPRTR